MNTGKTPHTPIIYLDTKDWSDLARVGKRPTPPGTSTALALLNQLVEKGQIQLVYSYINICELLKYSDDMREVAQDTLLLMNNLANNHCVIHSNSLWKLEIESSSKVDQIDTISSRGHWTPDIDFASCFSRKQAIKEIKSTINDQMSSHSRKDRRRIQNQFVRNGFLTSKAMEILEPNSDEVANNLFVSMGLPRDFFDPTIIFDFMRGRTSNKALNESIWRILREPQVLASTTVEGFGHNEKLRQIFSGPSAGIVKLVSNKLEGVRVFYRNNPEQREDIVKLFWSQIDYPEFRSNLTQKIYKDVLSDQSVKDFGPTEVFDYSSLDIALRTMFVYSLYHIRTNRKAKKSDFADAIHFAYGAYVDFISLDKAFFDISKSLHENIRAQPVSSLKELVDILSSIDTNSS